MGFQLIDQLPYSPDLNPVKNLQSILKQAIYNKFPELEFATQNEENLQALVRAAQEV